MSGIPRNSVTSAGGFNLRGGVKMRRPIPFDFERVLSGFRLFRPCHEVFRFKSVPGVKMGMGGKLAQKNVGVVIPFPLPVI